MATLSYAPDRVMSNFIKGAQPSVMKLAMGLAFFWDKW
jgi:hypothetical protein